MTATLFLASKDGNVELVSSLLDQPSVDIDARDDTGLTALHHAVRGNHIDVVSQLLAKGANAVDVAQDPALKHNDQLAFVINNALQHTQSAAFQSAPVVDSHGGKQLPDGTVSYVQPPAYQPQSVEASIHQQQAMQHAMSQPMYSFQAQHAFFDPSHNPEHRTHAPKDSSSGSLPPPEVAKLIPCRFFPNCRYGEKCIFAHPAAMPTSPSNAAPVSPGQGPMFYQSPPYAYPAYGPPRHFYSMAPPMPMQYSHAGVPMPVHMPPPHMAPAPHSAEHHFAAQSHHAFAPSPPQQAQSEAINDEATQETPTEAVAATSAGAEADNSASAAGPGTAVAETAKASVPSSSANTTSFSAFMAHHATPFQPGPGAQNGVSVGVDGSILNGSSTFPRGTKGSRRGGASMGGSFGSRTDFNKRSTERPACHFFARSACKHGEDCRFPHILPDGTDMRGPNAGRSNHSIEASRAINRALAAKSAKGSANGTHVSSSNAAHSSQASNTGVDGDSSNPAPASTKVTASTSPASALTTINPADVIEAANASTDKAASDSSEKSTVSNAPLSPAAPAVKKDQGNVPKSNTPTASTSTPKVSNGNGVPAGKSEVKNENGANGKRAPAVNKTDVVKHTSVLASSGNTAPASIPSKPVLNGNANGSANGNRQNSASRPQPNGVQGGKGHQNQSQNGTRGRTNQNSNGRANGQAGQNGAVQKKSAPQRLPNADDFPALPNGHGPAAPSSSVPANNAKGVAKVNFSAVLSAPAPVKKQPEPVKDAETASADEKASSSADEAKEASNLTKEEEIKSGSAKQPAANGTAAPMLDFAAVVQSNPVAV
ncbi:uncharacterized protein MEPE_02877 [Melanopsichium pennsylvanicum]|uniref:C3H1-type domain-containing protein n=2 Tax=Melanopsichium pennsylvanicum TaxID=63383 RepID=A0AAJ4XKS2_9BASI|nr:conserved hypothetical protein [Melanopsichium pennsylvanicum 4]SNX84169.1 uncharacterized protein MEPE_02877 [Melanopsichium pennsylvanicum]